MMWILKEEETFVFKHPFRCYIAGPSNCGKTTLIQQILLNQHKLIKRPIEKIVICYKTMQTAYEVFKYLTNDVEFCEGLIDIKKFDATKNNLLIIDDLMEQCKDNNEILNLFTVDSHRRNISVFLVSQNIYTKGKFTRDINLNSSNMILFKNPRDSVQISILARQMFPNRSKAFMEAFMDAVENYRYIFLDFDLETSDKLRIQTNIVDDKRIIYTFI